MKEKIFLIMGCSDTPWENSEQILDYKFTKEEAEESKLTFENSLKRKKDWYNWIDQFKFNFRKDNPFEKMSIKNFFNKEHTESEHQYNLRMNKALYEKFIEMGYGKDFLDTLNDYLDDVSEIYINEIERKDLPSSLPEIPENSNW